jgi:hypothetical protein
MRIDRHFPQIEHRQYFLGQRLPGYLPIYYRGVEGHHYREVFLDDPHPGRCKDNLKQHTRVELKRQHRG